MVRVALAHTLANEFGYRVRDDTRKILAAKRDPLPISQELGRFDVQAIQVTATRSCSRSILR
jgi:hypothetical protein